MSNIGSVSHSGGGLSPLHDGSSTDGVDAGSTASLEPVRLGSGELAGGAFDAINAGGELALGSRGDDVKLLQQLLVKLGYPAGTPDGAFGRNTERSLAQFQKEQGVTASGRFDQATLAALDQAIQLGDTKNPTTARNDLVFLGMGDGGIHEIKDLQSRGVKVLGITDSAAGDDKVRIGGKTYDLQSAEGIDGFLGAIGVSGDKKAELAAIIEGAGADGRDECALMVQTFVEAERGDRTIERFVMSGHSVGDGVWGDNNGDFAMDTLKSLCETFPRAAAQVEDFMIAGCYSSSEQQVERFRAMFPNLKTAWAYGDSAPGTWSGAMAHNLRWERATRGSDPSAVHRGLAEGTRKGENVATWNLDQGYMADGVRRPLTEARADLDGMRSTYDAFLSGEQTIENTQYGPVRDVYRVVQEMLGNTSLPASERPALEQMRDQSIRVIFYDHIVKKKFADAHGSTVSAGFQALGMTPPDLSTLSRKDALAQIAAFEAKLGSTSPRPAEAEAARPLLEGLRTLSREVIPNNWV